MFTNVSEQEKNEQRNWTPSWICGADPNRLRRELERLETGIQEGLLPPADAVITLTGIHEAISALIRDDSSNLDLGQTREAAQRWLEQSLEDLFEFGERNGISPEMIAGTKRSGGNRR